MDQKDCGRCGRELPYSRFHRNASTYDGYAYWCDDCVAERRHATFDPASLLQECRTCEIWQPLPQFDRHNRTFTGYTDRCTACRLRAQQRRIERRLAALAANDDIDAEIDAWLAESNDD